MPEFSSPLLPPSRNTAKAGGLVARRYRLIRQIAQGGMAQVWEAEDEILTRPVAIKILLAHLEADHLFVKRFRQEALSAARLSHPNIVSVYDTFSDDFEAIVMELIAGQTLRTYLDEHHRLSAEMAVNIAIQVCEGLNHAHEQGVIHRDIKPGNILIDTTGRALITDFGIAKAESHDDLTEINQVVGTAKYLSPEQAEGHSVDTRSDLYSLGIVLYEMLCGVPPFVADSKTATALARLTQEPAPIRSHRQDIHPALEALIDHCLARRRDDRFQDAASLIEALENVAFELDDPTAHLQSRKLDDLAATSVSPRSYTSTSTISRANERRSSISRSTLTLMGISFVTIALVVVAIATTDAGQSLINRLAEKVGLQVGPLESLRVVKVDSFDPYGSDGEHDEKLQFMIDGNPETAWTTERYIRPDISGLKQGVGFVLSLDQPTRIETLTIESPTVGWRASFYVSQDVSSELEDWGTPVTTQEGLSGKVSIDLRGRYGANVLVWITHLGDGRSGPRYSMQVNEIGLLG